MPQRTWIRITAGVVVGVFALGLWTSGVAVEADWLRYFSLAVLAATILFAVWDKWGWRYRPFRHAQSVPPVLHGTWKGVLTTLWQDPNSGARPGAKPAYLVVRQTASSVHVTLLTESVHSSSSLANIQRAAGGAALTYVYLATPGALVSTGNPMHHGAAMLHITGSPATRLRGRYWTDRDSSGELDFTEHVNGLADDVDDAATRFT
jgi:hypothetical protein